LTPNSIGWSGMLQVDTPLIRIGMARCDRALLSRVSACYSDIPLNLCLLDPADPMQRLKKAGC